MASQDLLDVQETLYTVYFDASDGRNTQSLELQLTITGKLILVSRQGHQMISTCEYSIQK